MYNYPYGDNQQINLNWIISEIIALHQRLDPDYTAPTFTQIYPFSETQQLNLDWILTELKALKDLAPTPPPTELIDEIGQALIAGAYDADTSYQKNDYIVQDGKVYRANAATTGTFDPTKWSEVMLGNDLAIITRWADATNTFLNSLAASNVANDSSVTGTTVKDALNTLKTATDAAVTDVKYNAGYLKKTIGGADSNIIQIEDSPTNDSSKLPSSKAVYNANAAIDAEATARANADAAINTIITDIQTKQITYAASVENGDNATKAYSAGDYLVWKGGLYRALTDIANGAALISGTNMQYTYITIELQPLTRSKTGTITKIDSTNTLNEERCEQRGKVCEIHFYIQKPAGSTFSTTGEDIVNISGIALPPKIIRTVAGGGANAYDATITCYAYLTAQGVLGIRPATACRTINVDFIYTID